MLAVSENLIMVAQFNLRNSLLYTGLTQEVNQL